MTLLPPTEDINHGVNNIHRVATSEDVLSAKRTTCPGSVYCLSMIDNYHRIHTVSHLFL